MTNLKILHLSDLHCKAAGSAQSMVLYSLSEKIGELCRNGNKPNLLIITGDIAYSGKPEEYEQAKVFINDVIRHCSIETDRVFIIPGNHDVDRSKMDAFMRERMYQFDDEATLLNIFASPFYVQMQATTAAYFDFAKEYMPNITFGKYGQYTASIPFGNWQLRIVGLNSALFCGYDGDDKRQLALGLEQVHNCFSQSVADNEIVIGCVHHPFHCFHECDKASRVTFQRNADIILSGHVHDPHNTARHDGNEGDTIFITAGAGFEKRETQNGFNIIELDAASLQGKVVFYKYLPNGHEWIPNKDINHKTNGEFYFTINKGGRSTGATAEASASVGKTAPLTIPIPKPPALYAKPKYLGSHDFTGRKAELDILDDWAKPADSYTILLFEAMGGSGKSMLTWHWVNQQTKQADHNWAGIFWYSFYEKGAEMADFCRHALAYITGNPFEVFRELKTVQLQELLLPLLSGKPWLIVLDGLERVLYEYNTNRYAEETLGNQIVAEKAKDPCDSTNPQDDILLLQLATVTSTKILVSSRLRPRVWENKARQPIPKVKCHQLPGLRPADAAALLRQCGICGDSRAMEEYLTTNCGCHPLTVGALAGIINDYMPDRGNFDKWLKDSDGAGQLNFADLDLVGRQNHILHIALNKLSPPELQLISTLALLYEAIDYEMLMAFNPHIPQEPEMVDKPSDPEASWGWNRLTDDEKEWQQRRYKENIKKWNDWQQASIQWKSSIAYKNASKLLGETIKELERRGLLQYDALSQRYDLHPVVRGVVSSRLNQPETERYGQQVVDFFSARPHNPYEKATTRQELADGLHIVRTLLRMGEYQQAFDAYQGDLSRALLYNVEIYHEIITLLTLFFTEGWDTLPTVLDSEDGSWLTNEIAIAKENIGETQEALKLYELAMGTHIEQASWKKVMTQVGNISYNPNVSYPAEKRVLEYVLALATLIDDHEGLFIGRLDLFNLLMRMGNWAEADMLWSQLDVMGRDWSRVVYRSGSAEYLYALFHFHQGILQQEQLDTAFQLAKQGNSRNVIRSLYWLQGNWQLNQANWQAAADNFGEALRMAREAYLIDASAETGLALTKYHLGQLAEPEQEATRLEGLKIRDNYLLARLWQAMGNKEKAKERALQAYTIAWGSGEPYVHRYNLKQATALLQELDEPIPQLPPYDPDKDEKFPWEGKIEAAIAKLQAEKAAKKKEDKDTDNES